MDFWKTNYPEYYTVGVRVLSEEELQDQDKYYWKNKTEIIYTGINPQMVKYFLAETKKKENGKIVSHVGLRKYHDALKWGAGKCKEQLPTEYYTEVETYLNDFRKESSSAKQDGNTDEEEADPISVSLFKLVLLWAVGAGNILVWVFTLLMWHCMSQIINIGILAFSNFGVFNDCITIKHFTTKTEKTGERINLKHCYCNRFDPYLNLNLALGVYFILNQLLFVDTSYLFIKKGKKVKSGSSGYCSQLTQLFTANAEAVSAYIRINHANPHGIRKGSATHAASGTTLPPSVTAIAKRGDWSLGKLLDIYWKFAETGDFWGG